MGPGRATERHTHSRTAGANAADDLSDGSLSPAYSACTAASGAPATKA
jgi:hypothetical protein